MFDSCMKFHKSLPENSGESVTVFNFLSEAVDSTLCLKEGSNYHRLSCLMRQCKECSVQNLKMADEEKSKELVKWKRYDYMTYQDKSGEERCKIALVHK